MFSKFFESSVDLLGEKICAAVLNSLSQAAEAGKRVFTFRDKLHTAGNDLRTSMVVAVLAKYPSSCLCSLECDPAS